MRPTHPLFYACVLLLLVPLGGCSKPQPSPDMSVHEEALAQARAQASESSGALSGIEERASGATAALHAEGGAAALTSEAREWFEKIEYADTHTPTTDTHRKDTEVHLRTTDTHKPTTEWHLKDTDTHKPTTQWHLRDTNTHKPDTEVHLKDTNAHKPTTEWHRWEEASAQPGGEEPVETAEAAEGG